MGVNKKEYLITAFFIVVLVVVILIVSMTQNPPEHLIAKVRYFDGSMDTLRIKDYRTINNTILLITDSERQVVVGANNVIIIEDEDY